MIYDMYDRKSFNCLATKSDGSSYKTSPLNLFFIKSLQDTGVSIQIIKDERYYKNTNRKMNND